MDKVLVEIGAVSRVTINRPEKHNALDTETAELIVKAMMEASASKECRSIIISGSGGSAFCSGADLNYLYGLSSQAEAEKAFDLFYRLRRSIIDSSKFVVAMIDGYCLGGGNEIAIACDARLASKGSFFGQPEVRLGLVPGGGSTYALAQLVGLPKAKEMILTGRNIDAYEALDIGLVNGIFEKAELSVAVGSLCNSVAACSPGAVAMAKSAINKAYEPDYRNERMAFARSVINPEAKDGIRAFLDHKQPRFSREV